MKTVTNISLSPAARRATGGRELASVEIEDDAYAILAGIGAIEDQVERILAEGMLPLFADVIRLRFQPEEEEE